MVNNIKLYKLNHDYGLVHVNIFLKYIIFGRLYSKLLFFKHVLMKCIIFDYYSIFILNVLS